MRYVVFSVVVGCLAVVLAAPPTDAAINITSNGSVNLVDPAAVGSPPITNVKFLQGGGFIFTNTVAGGPFVPGAEVRSVSVHSIGLAQDLVTFNNPILPNGSNLLVISAVRGIVTAGSPGAVVSASFTQGRSFLASDTLAYNAKLPSTWNIGSIFAEYDLKPAEPVFSGWPVGDPRFFTAAQMNASDINSGAATQSQGRFLFEEDSTAAQNAGSTPGMVAGTGGDNFIFNVDQSVIPPSYVFEEEVIIADVDQTLDILSWQDILKDTVPGFGAADWAALNTLAAASFSPGGGFATAVDLDLGAGGVQGWASDSTGGAGLGGALVTDWSAGLPFAPTPLPYTGDFRASFASDDLIGVQAIPEPASVAVWGLLMVLGAVCAVRRRK